MESKDSLSIRTVGLALTALFAVTYVLCVLFDLFIPGWAMSSTWSVMFPGFARSVAGFFIGLAETVIYSFYIAVVFVPVYNILHHLEHRGHSVVGKPHATTA